MLYEMVGSKNKERLFVYVLQNRGKLLSLREVSRNCGVAASHVKGTFDSMVKAGVMARNGKLYKLNERSYIVRALEPLFSKSSLMGLIKRAIMNALGKYKCSIALFGSASREAQGELSDIDVLVVCKDGDYQKLFEDAVALSQQLRETFPNEIEITPVEVSHFRRLGNMKDPFYINVMSERVVWTDSLKVFR